MLFFHEILNKSGLKYIVTSTYCTNSEIKGDTFLDFEWNMKCIGLTMFFFFICVSIITFKSRQFASIFDIEGYFWYNM